MPHSERELIQYKGSYNTRTVHTKGATYDPKSFSLGETCQCCSSETAKFKSARDSQYGGEKREMEFKSHFRLLKNSAVLADIGFSKCRL